MELWVSVRDYKRHIKRRFERNHIKSIDDYLTKIKDTFLNPDEIKWKKYKQDYKIKNNRLDRFYYRKGDFWIDVFLENGKITTAFKMDKKRYETIILEGNINTFDIFDISIKDLRDERV